jgi:hypothetical protein
LSSSIETKQSVVLSYFDAPERELYHWHGSEAVLKTIGGSEAVLKTIGYQGAQMKCQRKGDEYESDG